MYNDKVFCADSQGGGGGWVSVTITHQINKFYNCIYKKISNIYMCVFAKVIHRKYNYRALKKLPPKVLKILHVLCFLSSHVLSPNC